MPVVKYPVERAVVACGSQGGTASRGKELQLPRLCAPHTYTHTYIRTYICSRCAADLMLFPCLNSCSFPMGGDSQQNWEVV